MRKSTKLAVVFAAAMLLVVGFAMTAIAGTAHWDSSTGQWQYINADGDVVTNDKIKWQGKYYFVDEDGNLVTNKLWEFDGARYYTDANGNLVTGWVKVPADEADEELEVTYRWYYFQSSGKAFTANNYATGVQYKTIDGKRYKFDTDGKML
ncbi:MAG: hypothetical protein Q4B67_08880, partial [Eubacteriales bacterium]|nr:hypothetical protein [Eubacteriales bacterium]